MSDETVTPAQILATPMYPDENSARATTAREYLATLLARLWTRREEFDPVRPCGSSMWWLDLYRALGRAGLIDATFEGDRLTGCDTDAARRLIAAAIVSLGYPDPLDEALELRSTPTGRGVAEPMPITPETVDAVLSELAPERERADGLSDICLGSERFTRLYDALRTCLDALEGRSPTPTVGDGGESPSTGTLDGRSDGSEPDLTVDELAQLRAVVAYSYRPGDDPTDLPPRIAAYALEPDGGMLALVDLATRYARRLEPRVINNPEDLDALPVGAVVRTDGGRIAQKTSGGYPSPCGRYRAGWMLMGADEIEAGTNELDDLPALVVWSPPCYRCGAEHRNADELCAHCEQVVRNEIGE